MSNFWARTITGLSMVFILLAGLYFNEWIFASLFFVIAILGILEFYQIVTSENCQPQKIYGVLAGAILYITITGVHDIPFSFDYISIKFIPFFLPIPLFFIPFIIEIYRKKPGPLINIALSLMIELLNSAAAMEAYGPIIEKRYQRISR